MPNHYLASSIPAHHLAELHRLMHEEIKEVAVFFMDARGIITVWNQACEAMKGYTAREAIGGHLSLLYTEEQRARQWPLHNLKEAEKHGFYREETWRRRKDGTLFWARIALTALHDRGGKLLGFSKVTVDLTDHKLLERCLKEREETRRILRIAQAGTWTWTPALDRVEVSANFLGLLGHPDADATMSLSQWMGFVDPDHRAEVARKFESALAGCPRGPLTLEARMCHQDGRCRWFSMHADWYREKERDAYVLSGVSVSIHALKTAGEELQSAVQKLKEADARKDEFLAMLAHELRNPLAPIRTAAELLKRADLGQARLEKTSDIISKQVEHMTGLVDDLLDVSRVTRGLVQLQRMPLDVRDIASDAVEQVAPLIRQKSHQLSVRLAPDPATVLGDPKRLVQVIANLLNNAAKYTPEGGSIVLETRVLDSSVLLSVSDNGVGMDRELAARAFELFTQANRTPDRSSGGLGLGLALVKSLVELHGGTVTCASDGIGRGSTFTVELPLVRARSLPRDPRPPVPADLQPAARPLRVMVVDDNVDAAETLAMYLQAIGHEVMVEHDAKRALERSRSEPPHAFILDIGLPEINGNELAQRLKAEAETAGAVFIAVTGYGQERDRQSALAAGFDHYLVKPVDPAVLATVLARLDAGATGDQ